MRRLSATDFSPSLHAPNEWAAPARVAPVSAAEIEIHAVGSAHGPHPQCVEESNAALEDLLTVERGGALFLDAFVDRWRVAGRADASWGLVGIRAELDEETPIVKVFFELEGDTYGYWSVGFRDAGGAGRFFPVFFSRQTY